jgi:hypothetical protein
MSLYNIVHGMSPVANLILAALELEVGDFGRFRDAWFRDDAEGGGLRILVHTRCGGGNREDYEKVFETMRRHPDYLRDYDEVFDSTYANIEFKIRASAREAIDELLIIFDDKGKRELIVDNRTQQQKWDAATKVLLNKGPSTGDRKRDG